MNHPPNYWGPVLNQLLAFEDMPESVPPEAPSIQKSISCMDLQIQLLHAETVVSDEVDIAIRAWPADKEPWARLSDLGIYFLRLRSEVSLEFVSHLVGAIDYDGRLMFTGHEDIPPVDFARYLLTEWWLSAGREMAAKKLILEWHGSNAKS